MADDPWYQFPPPAARRPPAAGRRTYCEECGQALSGAVVRWREHEFCSRQCAEDFEAGESGLLFEE